MLPEQNPAAAETEPRRLCEVCGAPTRVQILVRYTKEGPLLRTFCLDCGKNHLRRSDLPGVSRRTSAWLLLAVAGAVILTVGVFGDWIIPARQSGFGWQQGGGVVLGAIVGLFGVLMAADLVTLAGVFLLCVALSADWFGLTQGSGIGPKQQCIIVVGLICLVIAMLWRLRVSLRHDDHRDAGRQQSSVTSASPAVARG